MTDEGAAVPDPAAPRAAAPDATADRRTGALLVAGQFLLLGLVVLLPGGSAWSLPPWASAVCWGLMLVGVGLMVVAALGLGRGLTAMPLPNEHAELRTGGLYRLVRHPIYSGLLLFAVADTARSGSLLVLAVCAVLVALMTVKARFEERRLADRFPGYAAYAARTGRFVPRIIRRGGPATTPPDPGRRPAR